MEGLLSGIGYQHRFYSERTGRGDDDQIANLKATGAPGPRESRNPHIIMLLTGYMNTCYNN
jgi:hypothetical protein